MTNFILSGWLYLICTIYLIYNSMIDSFSLPRHNWSISPLWFTIYTTWSVTDKFISHKLFIPRESVSIRSTSTGYWNILVAQYSIISFNFLAVRCENTLKNIENTWKNLGVEEKNGVPRKISDGLTWIIRTPCSRKSWWIEGRARRIAVIYAEIRERRNARGADVTWSRRKTRSHSRDRNFPPLSAWQSFHAVDTFSPETRPFFSL